MRPIPPPDIDILTRVVLVLPPAARSATVRAILDRADLADRFRKRLGRVHPEHGDGSVLWLAARCDRTPHRFCDAAYWAALDTVVGAVRAWREERAVRAAQSKSTHQKS